MKYFLALPVSLLLFSCNGTKEDAKAIINKSGEVVGETASEFVDGVSQGVEKTLERDLTISPELQKRGITTGKVVIADDSDGNSNNVLSIYVIFNKDFSGKMTAKVTDKTGKESGRSVQQTSAKAGEARYLDFVFDRRAHIDVKSTIAVD
jgi:hypothetical protein